MSQAELNQLSSLRVSPPEPLVDRDSLSFFASLVFHLALLLALGFVPVLFSQDEELLTLVVQPVEEMKPEEEFTPPKEFHINERPMEEVGANSVQDAEMALSTAEVLAEVSDVPSPVEVRPIDVAKIEINNAVQVATALHLDNLRVRGAAGEGTTGATGAIDRLTQEILLSLEERPTLVVWLFDQSGSLTRQRREIEDRFEKIYEELGVIEAAGNPAFKSKSSKPLLTSVVAFGDKVNFLVPDPSDDVAELREAIRNVDLDETGNERVFSAVYLAADKFKKFRLEAPRRNVMLIVVTDEVGDDQEGLDKTVNFCRRLEIPVFVIGVPAPFGRSETLVKWVDPNPEYDQTPQWGSVNQGPETLLPERVNLSFSDGHDPDPMDSGFGPFALTRLCYETGGIYFTVHPNRNVNRSIGQGETAEFAAHLKRFFDPEVMRRYRPDYVSAAEYLKKVGQNKARVALIQAARMTWTQQLEQPQLRFVKSSEAELSNSLSEAQKAAAVLEPRIEQLYEVLKLGESDRAKEVTPRWQAGYDLAMGRVLAAKVRTESYNAMLAQAKRGMKFADEKNNTWLLKAEDEISVGSALAKTADQAKTYLNRVIAEHPGTPWALLAERELNAKLGWRWQEEFTNLEPPPAAGPGGGGGTPAPARNERPQMLAKPIPKRPPPKL